MANLLSTERSQCVPVGRWKKLTIGQRAERMGMTFAVPGKLRTIDRTSSKLEEPCPEPWRAEGRVCVGEEQEEVVEVESTLSRSSSCGSVWVGLVEVGGADR